MINFVDHTYNNTTRLELASKPASDMIADQYDSTKKYSVGDYVIYQYSLYKCIVEITTPENWNATKWQSCVLTDLDAPVAVTDKIFKGSYNENTAVETSRRTSYANNRAYICTLNNSVVNGISNLAYNSNITVIQYNVSNMTGNYVVRKAYHGGNNEKPAVVVTDNDGTPIYTFTSYNNRQGVYESIPITLTSNARWVYINCRYSERNDAILALADEHLNPQMTYNIEEVIENRLSQLEDELAPVTKKMFIGIFDKDNQVDRSYYSTYTACMMRKIGNTDITRMDSNYNDRTVIKYSNLSEIIQKYGTDFIISKTYHTDNTLPAVNIISSNGTSLYTYTGIANTEITDLRIQMPVNASALYINCLISQQDEARLYTASEHFTPDQTYTVEEIVDKKIADINIYDMMQDYYSVDYDATVKSINFRGYSTEAPENTLPAFIMSKNKGFKYVEADVSYTSDGIPVLLADQTIDRTSNGVGAIASMTYAKALTYDFGSWMSSEFTGTKIPTLSEFLKLCKYIGLFPYINLKFNALYTTQQIHDIIELVWSYGLRDVATFISRSLDYLQIVKDKDPKARLGYTVDGSMEMIITDIVSACQSLKTANNEVFCNARLDMIHPGDCEPFIQGDIPLEIWGDLDSPFNFNDNYISGVMSSSYNAGRLLYNQFIPVN